MLISKLPNRLAQASSMATQECTGLPPFTLETRVDKDGWLSSPARFKPATASRTAENVLDVGWLVLDVDEAATDRAEAFLGALLGGDLAVLVHSTHRYDPNRPKFRCWVPLSRPVMRDDWRRFWLRAVKHVGAEDIVDQACKDPGRWYYDPSQPPGGQGFLHALDGKALDVDAVWALPEVAERFTATVGKAQLNGGFITAWLSNLRKSPNPAKEQMADAWARVRDGEAWAEDGQVHTVARDLTMALALRSCEFSPESVGAFFAPSCAFTGDGTYTPELVAKLYEGAVVRCQENQHRAETTKIEADRLRIRIATGGAREAPYTKEEVNKWRHALPWILQKDTAYWALVNGQYVGPYSAREAQTALRNALTPAEACGEVQLDRLTMQGTVTPRGLQDLVDTYGQVISNVRYSYTDPTAYDPESKVLTLQTAKRVAVKAAFHEGVDKWLELLGGPKLKEWLGHMHRLDRPLPALFMVGTKGVGKTALAVALARLWEGGAYTPLDVALGKYNTPLIRNPVVFADEGLPKDHGNRPRTQAFRRFVQESMRWVEGKFLPAIPLEGCVRVLVASNSLDVLFNDENLTTDDLDAISERILMVRPGPELEAYVKDVPFRMWMDAGIVTEHLAWAIENAPPPAARETRFLVSANDATVSNSLATGTSWGSNVCEWLMDFLENPDRLALRTDDAAQRITVRTVAPHFAGGQAETRMLVCSKALKTHWDIYGDPRLIANARNIGRAIATIAPKRSKLQLDQGEVDVRVVDLDMLRTWCDNVGRDSKVLPGLLARCEARLTKKKKETLS